MNDQVTIRDFFFIPLDENTFSRTLDELVPKLSALIAPHAQVFKRNLASVVSVVSFPFYMAVASVQGRRFALLYAAERIRARNHMDADGNVPEWAEKEAYTIASAKMAEEPTTKEGKEGANKVAGLVLEELATARENDEFSIAANELLRQGAILVWGALEVLVVDLFVTLLNNRPDLLSNLLRDEASKKLFRDLKSLPIDVLEQYGFDISHNIGDILVSYHNIDSVPVMKTVFSALFPANLKLRDSLSMRELFVLNQRRHLIVHRRGIVDAEYAKLTKDETPVGTELRITPSELEHYLELVRDTGVEIMLAANSVILPEPKP